MMQRIQLNRTILKSKPTEKQLMKLLQGHINASGMIIYPGKTSEESRTGSPIMALLNYMFGRDKIKPIDYDLCVSFIDDLKKQKSTKI